MTTTTVACAHCATPFEPRTSTARYCSIPCRRRAAKARERCHPHTCQRCGTDFTGRIESRFCSQQCSALEAARSGGYRKTEMACVGCGTPIIAGPHTKEPRCPACPRPRPPRKNAARPTPQQVLDSRAKAKQARPCAQCGESFKPTHVAGAHARFCTRACARKHHSHNGKARRRLLITTTRTGDISRAAVLERDAWCCHICGDPIDRDAAVPHPRAATLDHVVALANGGTHTMDNLRAAHFICNCLKSNG